MTKSVDSLPEQTHPKTRNQLQKIGETTLPLLGHNAVAPAPAPPTGKTDARHASGAANLRLDHVKGALIQERHYAQDGHLLSLTVQLQS